MERSQSGRISLKNKKHNFSSIENNVVAMEARVIKNRRSRSLNLLRSEQSLFPENKNLVKHTAYKTSAEIIKEAEKSLLARNSQGLVLVSTNRPITPRDLKRQLYGKVAPPERPPSAINLRLFKRDFKKSIPCIEEQVFSITQSKSVESFLDLNLSNINLEKHKLPSMSSAKNDSKINELKQLDVTKLSYFNNPIKQTSTETLIELLKDYNGINECTNETIQHIDYILQELHRRVKNGKPQTSNVTILTSLYGLVECSSPKIILSIARIILTLSVSGSNMTGAYKLIFKVAQNDANDQLFYDTDLPELLIDGLGRASPIEDSETCIYGYGTVRFLSNSSKQYLNEKKENKSYTLAERLCIHGAVQLMVLHLQILNEYASINKLKGPPLHALYQLSAALRTLASISLMDSTFCNNKEDKDKYVGLDLACPHLIKAGEIAFGEIELQSNIVRTLSVFSENEACLEILSNFSDKIGILFGNINLSSGTKPEIYLTLLSRVSYILGNVMSAYDYARVQFYQNDVAMEYFMQVFQHYTKLNLNLYNCMGDTNIDVLIKMIRVIANMSVNPEVGRGLGTRLDLGVVLLNLLKSNMKDIKANSAVCEMLQSTLGSLHNLCFYQGSDESETHSAVWSLSGDISTVLCDILKNEAGIEFLKIEAVRVLGNITLNKNARISFCQNNGIQLMLSFLDASCYDLKVNSAGVLVNVLGDYDKRPIFDELKGAEILKKTLVDALSQHDVILATIVCQCIWNFLLENSTVNKVDENFCKDIYDLLLYHMDDDTDPEWSSNVWLEFANVATDLIDKFQLIMQLDL
ncbi:ARMC2 family protein [Megaselia abdita]